LKAPRRRCAPPGDYKPAERAKYVDTVFANIDWQAVEARMASRTAVRRRAAR